MEKKLFVNLADEGEGEKKEEGTTEEKEGEEKETTE